jgi:hypothetical protein
MTERIFLGVWKTPTDWDTLSPAERLAWAKPVADAIRERCGEPPTDENGKAPQ